MNRKKCFIILVKKQTSQTIKCFKIVAIEDGSLSKYQKIALFKLFVLTY